MTKRMLIERIRKSVAGGFPTRDFKVTENEISLMIDSEAARNIVATSYSNYKIEGCAALIGSFITTFKFTSINEDADTGMGYIDLPMPPLGMSLGYSVPRVYFGGGGTTSTDLVPVNAKQSSIYRDMPRPKTATFFKIQNNRLWIDPYVSLGDFDKLFVEMVNSRTDDLDAVLNFPDDIIDSIYKSIVDDLRKRYAIPQDINNDGNDLRIRT